MGFSAEKLRIAHLGCGAWGSNLVRELAAHPDVSLDLVIDPHPEARRLAHSLAPTATVAHSIEALTKSSFDAVVVATPGPLHARHATLALASDADVFVEKPMSTNLMDAQELVSLCRSKSRIGMVGHLLLHHPGVRTMFDSIREGKVGVPLIFRSERLSPLNRNVDGSLLWSLAPHDLSVLHALDPSAVKKVEADPSLLGRDGVFNQVDLKLHFGSGLRAHITVSTAHHRKVRRMQVIGQEGTMVFDDVGREPTLLLIRGDRMERVAFDTSLPPLRAEVDAFVHCVRKRQQPETGFSQGRDVVALIERTQQIIREKCPKQRLHLSGSVF